MRKTLLRHFDSFWLGQFGNPTIENFYRIDSKTEHLSEFNDTAIVFGMDLDQRLVTYTQYSVIDFLQNVPALLLISFKFLVFLSGEFSAFNFRLAAISNLYSASVGK